MGGDLRGLPNGTTVERFPENGVWPTADTVTQAAKADILHITCHGGIQVADWETMWTSTIRGFRSRTASDRRGSTSMAFVRRRPLPSATRARAGAGPATATGLTPGLPTRSSTRARRRSSARSRRSRRRWRSSSRRRSTATCSGEPGRRRRVVADEVRLQGGRRAGSVVALLLPLRRSRDAVRRGLSGDGGAGIRRPGSARAPARSRPRSSPRDLATAIDAVPEATPADDAGVVVDTARDRGCSERRPRSSRSPSSSGWRTSPRPCAISSIPPPIRS